MRRPTGQIVTKSASQTGLTGLLTVTIAFLTLALIVIFLEQHPGRLAIELGFMLALFSILTQTIRPLIIRFLSVKDAESEFTIGKGISLAFWTSVVLVLLGFLNLMGVVPWR